tara:strand:+ start:329 stop:772 length:444 start_codon:yes stop_codon:yes gene_type:complete
MVMEICTTSSGNWALDADIGLAENDSQVNTIKKHIFRFVIRPTYVTQRIVNKRAREYYPVMAAPRNYKKEYKSYHAKPKQKKRRAQRNTARAKMVKAGKARKGDGKDVDHKNRNTADNRKKNLRVVSKSKNRSFPRKKSSPVKRKKR